MNPNIPYTSLDDLYGDENPILDELFPAYSYINFGYYPYPLNRLMPISIEERIKSEEALYDYIFEKLDLQLEDHVLEVGCGRGDGAVRLSNRFQIGSIKGMDLTSQQILRALIMHHEILESDAKLSFHIGSAERMPFREQSINKIYSIGSAQHFHSMASFAKECRRVLQSFGKVVVTTFFARDKRSLEELKIMMPLNIGKVDKVKTVDEIKEAFQRENFTLTALEEIGKSVFPFFDQWLSERETQNWGRLWAKAWQEGLIEYEIFTFQTK